MKKKSNLLERAVHGIFLVLGLITVACVLVITAYLVISGIPAIHEIGLVDFLFGEKWASTATEPAYGILPFILTSIYGTAGAIAIGVPIGFLTAVYLAKMAPKKVKEVVGQAVSFCCLRSGWYDGSGSWNSQGVSCTGWRQPAGIYHRAGYYDPAFHHQDVRYCPGSCS